MQAPTWQPLSKPCLSYMYWEANCSMCCGAPFLAVAPNLRVTERRVAAVGTHSSVGVQARAPPASSSSRSGEAAAAKAERTMLTDDASKVGTGFSANAMNSSGRATCWCLKVAVGVDEAIASSMLPQSLPLNEGLGRVTWGSAAA
jgi:hypothetical protein